MGDKTISYDPDNPVDVERAMRDVEAMKAAGYAIQSVGLGKVIATMNPDETPSPVEFAAIDDAETKAQEYDDAIQEGMDHTEEQAEKAADELKEMDPKPTIDEE